MLTLHCTQPSWYHISTTSTTKKLISTLYNHNFFLLLIFIYVDWGIKAIVFLTLLIFSPLRERAIALLTVSYYSATEFFWRGVDYWPSDVIPWQWKYLYFFFCKCSHSIILNSHNTTFLPLRLQKNLSQPSITIIFSYSVSRLRNL